MTGVVARGALVLGAQQIVAFGAMMALHVATGRYFGPELYGLFSVTHAILSLLAFTLLSGVPQAVARFSAERPDAAFALFRQGLGVQITVGLAAAAALAASADFIAGLLGDRSFAPLLRVGAIVLPFTGVSFLAIYSLNGLHRFGRQAFVLGVLNVLKVGAVIAFLWTGSGPLGAVRGLVLASVVTAVVAFLSVSSLPRGGSFPSRTLLRTGAQLSATIFAVALWERVDLLMLGWLGTRPEDVGLFSASSALTSAPGSLLLPLLIALFPAISRATAEGALDRVASYVGEAITWSYRLLVPLAIGAFLLADDLLALFYGTEYLAAAFVVGPLVVATLFYSVYELLDTWLRGSGRQSTSWRLAGGLLATHIALNLVLIPRWEMKGVVVTSVVSAVAAAVVTAVPAARLLGIRPRALPVIRPVVAAVIAFAPLAFWSPEGALKSVALALPLLALYVGLLFALRELGAADVRHVRDLFARVAATSPD